MTSNRTFLVSIAASIALALNAPCQSDSYAVSLMKSATSCKLTVNFAGPANGTAVLFAGLTGGAPVTTQFGTLHLTKGLVRVQSVQLSPTGTASLNFQYPNGLAIGLQSLLLDGKGNPVGLSSYGAISLERSAAGAAMAGAATYPQKGSPTAQLAIEAGARQKIELRDPNNAVVTSSGSYRTAWGGWNFRPLNIYRVFAVYVDGMFWGYIYL